MSRQGGLDAELAAAKRAEAEQARIALMRAALLAARGNRTHAARALGMSIRTFFRWVARFPWAFPPPETHDR